MKITKDIEMEVMGVHNLFWESYARRDIELRFSLCSEDITFIGSGLHERALNKTEYKNINKEGVKQFPDPFQIEFLWTNITMLRENIACVESEVVWSQLINNEMFKELLRNTTLLKRDNSKWLVTHVHGSVPDYRLKKGDYMTNEQTIIRNRELERQVFERTQDLNKTLEELEQKNRELEIEGALEKVRTIAMGMRKPDDMLDVCKTISLQLQSLGVKEIRNVQSAIFYEHRSTYMNYEYYAKHDKTFITETVFTNHEVHNEFATKMMKGKGETFITHIKGSEVKDWIAYQKTTNVFIDKYLETASSLNYYWFSLGPVALGISTYVPLTDDEINLFKRFLKVFELAYQRYLDIEIAEAQARDAQIEASLERVRAVAMGMNKSDDLLSICEVSFKEFKKLGFDNIRNALIHIQYDNQKYFMDYDFSDLTGGAVTKIEYGSHPVVQDYVKQIRSAEDAFYQGVIEEDQLEEWKDFRRNSGQINDPRLDKATALYYYFFSIGIGDIGISTLKSIDDSQIKILKRFRNVFALSYQRYIDISNAEAQSREAQIELALERVRARTMAMQRSEELSDTAAVLFQEIKKISKEELIQLTIGNYNEAAGLMEFRVTSWAGGGEYERRAFNLSIEEPTLLKPAFKAWKQKKKSIVFDLTGEKLKGWLKYRNTNSGVKVQSADTNGRRVITIAFFSKGHISLSSPLPLSAETIQLLERFAIVFDGTYTRFLDLQRAEAQNKIIQADNDRKTKELEDARQLQLSMLPKKLPQLPHIDIAVYMKTATEVGGDYYDFSVDVNGTLTVVVGDATGHGMMSGMMVSIMKSFFISNRNSIDLKQFFENTNNSLKEMQLGRLMMPLIGVQINSDRLIATNAGMPSLLYFRNKSQKAGEFVSNNLPLGGMKGTQYVLKEIRYEIGDTLLLMSDGFAELKNSQNEQYGYKRVKEQFRSIAHKSVNEIIEELRNTASHWLNGAELEDDITFVVIKIR